MNGKNYAIEHGSGTDYLPGHPWNQSPSDAEQAWRKAKRLYFLAVHVRHTTAHEDSQLRSPSDVLNNLGR